MSSPRVVFSSEDCRVVALELPDQHGVIRTEYVIEMTERKDVDALGVQRWRTLTDKSALGDWIRATRRFLDDVLKHAGEKKEQK